MKTKLALLACLASALGFWLAAQTVRPAGGEGLALVNASGSPLDVNGTRLRVQAEAAGSGNSPQDVRADSWGDGVSNSIQQVMAYAAAAGWNGASFDRLRTTSADGSSRTGVLETASNLGGYAELTLAGTTAVKSTGGVLHKLVVNTPAAGTIGIYNVAGGSCTGTPGSGRIALVTLTASSLPVTLSYDLKATNGICLVSSAAADVTVVFE